MFPNFGVTSPCTHLFIVVESSRIHSSSKGWQMGQVTRLGMKVALAGSLGCMQVMWNEWPQFNLLYVVSSGELSWILIVHSGRSQTPNGPVHDRGMNNPLATNVGPSWRPRQENNMAERLRYVDNVQFIGPCQIIGSNHLQCLLAIICNNMQ